MKTSSQISTLLLLFAFWHASALFTVNNDVRTTSGTIRGTEVRFRGLRVKQYLGVPYAKPPVGDLRFKKPEPAVNRRRTIVADSMPPACIQYIEYPFPWYDFEAGKSEDCLYLNIWVPENLFVGRALTKKLPVMFWIYGGGFTLGSNRKPIYEGQALAAEGKVVVVTINYRMASFGFLTSGTEEAPANVGVYDMVAALKWVNQNIGAFGGDPSQLTLVGQSAGSIAIGLLCVSPLTKGLFKRVIMESGSPAYLLAENNNKSIADSQKLAKAVGCADDEKTIQNNTEEVVSCLRGKDAFELAKTLTSFHPTSARSFFPSYGDEVLPVNARMALINGDFHHVDVLIGSIENEAPGFTTSNPDFFGFFGEKDPKFNKSKGASMLRDMFATFEDPDAVVEYYLRDLGEEDFDRVRKQVYTASGDYSLLCPTVYFAESYSKKGNDVRYYYFTHRPSTTPWAEWLGAVHYEEVQFVFGVPLQKPNSYTKDEVALSKRVIGIWSNFAKSGSRGLSNSWPKYSKDNPTYVELNTKPGTEKEQGPNKNNCDFFRKYFGFQ